MVYETVDTHASIRQGDIFRDIPRADLSLGMLTVLDNGDTLRDRTWREVLMESNEKRGVAAMVSLLPVHGIVITQDCDAARSEFVSLCQIDDYVKTTGLSTPPKTANKWQSRIVSHSRQNARWFYLPEDVEFGFTSRMAADFRVTIRLPRVELMEFRDLRLGRLNDESCEHFRESLAQFFRRYPYDEWYPLTKDEYAAYAEGRDEVVPPRPWQE